MVDLNKKILNEAIEACLKEMYRCSQPSADYDKLKNTQKKKKYFLLLNAIIFQMNSLSIF